MTETYFKLIRSVLFPPEHFNPWFWSPYRIEPHCREKLRIQPETKMRKKSLLILSGRQLLETKKQTNQEDKTFIQIDLVAERGTWPETCRLKAVRPPCLQSNCHCRCHCRSHCHDNCDCHCLCHGCRHRDDNCDRRLSSQSWEVSTSSGEVWEDSVTQIVDEKQHASW